MTPASLEAGLIALERLRGEIDDEVLDLALTALRDRLDAERQGLAALPERQLRQVTVLFVDVVGSTAMGNRLDPEDIHRVVDTALARFTKIVERHHGRTLQYAGDSVLAAFGTDEAREDDAENAVAAGLLILGEARMVSDRVRREHDHPGFSVRVGAATGPVLLGGGVDAMGSIRGAVVNLAARMEQSAPPGSMRLSDETARQVQGLFDLQPQPPLLLKGMDQPLVTWLVERRRPLRAATRLRGVAGVATPLVGRDAALAALQTAWHGLHQADAGVQLLSLVAEPGLGKTRTVQHWEAWAQGQAARALWLQARARPQSERVPYALLHDLVADALQLPDQDSPAIARERFSAAVTPYFEADYGDSAAVADAHVLGHLLGLNFADSPHVRGIAQQGGQIRQRALHTAAELLARLAARQALPLVLLLDDLQWADSGSLDFLRGLPARQVSTPRPMLLLASARPTLDERQPGWAAAEHQRIALQPLPEADSRLLADALLAPLQGQAAEAAIGTLKDLLVGRAGGNPFFMEELLQMLIARGTLRPLGDMAQAEGLSGDDPKGEVAPTTAPRWQLDDKRLDIATLPTTLNGVLQAQLDVLPPAERQALQQAAVLGTVFWDSTLAALDDAAPGQLAALARRGLVQPRDAGGADAPASHGFAHAFLQQVAYERLLRPDRQRLHARAAQWYAALDTARAADFLPVTADHFARAADPLQAARYNLLAADNLAQRFAHDTVAEQAGLGLGHAAADDTATRWRLLMLRQRALRLSGRRDEQAVDLDAMAALAERTADPVQQATVALRRAVAADETGHPQEAAALAPLAMAAAQRAGDSSIELSVYGVWCGSLRTVGRHDEARDIGERGLARSRELGERLPESEMLVALGGIAIEQSQPVVGGALLRQALHLQQSLGNRAGECVSRINLGVTALQLGDLATAEVDFRAALDLARQIGNPTNEAFILLNLSGARLALCNLEAARQDALAAVALTRRIRNPEYEAFALISLGAVLLTAAEAGAHWQGSDIDGAAAAFEQARALLDGLGLPQLGIEAVAWQARLAHVTRDAPTALARASEALQRLSTQGNLDGTDKPLLIRWTLFEVLQAAGDPRAAGILAEAWQALGDRLSALPDETARQRFLQAQPYHLAIQAQASSAGPG